MGGNGGDARTSKRLPRPRRPVGLKVRPHWAQLNRLVSRRGKDARGNSLCRRMEDTSMNTCVYTTKGDGGGCEAGRTGYGDEEWFLGHCKCPRCVIVANLGTDQFPVSMLI